MKWVIGYLILLGASITLLVLRIKGKIKWHLAFVIIPVVIFSLIGIFAIFAVYQIIFG